MHRRDLLGWLTAGAAAGGLDLFSGTTRADQPTPGPAPSASSGLPPLKIADISTILTAPNRIKLVIVKVTTSEPGLYGIGCATHGERPLAVAAAIDQHVKPLLVGKECDRIEDIWQTSYVASYFRSGVNLLIVRVVVGVIDRTAVNTGSGTGADDVVIAYYRIVAA